MNWKEQASRIYQYWIDQLGEDFFAGLKDLFRNAFGEVKDKLQEVLASQIIESSPKPEEIESERIAPKHIPETKPTEEKVIPTQVPLATHKLIEPKSVEVSRGLPVPQRPLPVQQERQGQEITAQTANLSPAILALLSAVKDSLDKQNKVPLAPEVFGKPTKETLPGTFTSQPSQTSLVNKLLSPIFQMFAEKQLRRGEQGTTRAPLPISQQSQLPEAISPEVQILKEAYLERQDQTDITEKILDQPKEREKTESKETITTLKQLPTKTGEESTSISGKDKITSTLETILTKIQVTPQTEAVKSSSKDHEQFTKNISETIKEETSATEKTATTLPVIFEKLLDSLKDKITSVISVPEGIIVPEGTTPSTIPEEVQRPDFVKQEEQPFPSPKISPATQLPLPVKPIVLPGKQELKSVLETISSKGQLPSDSITSKLSKEQIKTEKETVKLPTKTDEESTSISGKDKITSALETILTKIPVAPQTEAVKSSSKDWHEQFTKNISETIKEETSATEKTATTLPGIFEKLFDPLKDKITSVISVPEGTTPSTIPEEVQRPEEESNLFVLSQILATLKSIRDKITEARPLTVQQVQQNLAKERAALAGMTGPIGQESRALRIETEQGEATGIERARGLPVEHPLLPAKTATIYPEQVKDTSKIAITSQEKLQEISDKVVERIEKSEKEPTAKTIPTTAPALPSTSTRLEKELESSFESIFSQVTAREVSRIGLSSPLNIVKERFTGLTPQAAAIQPEKPGFVKQEEQPLPSPKATPATQPPLEAAKEAAKPIILPSKQELKEVFETVSQKDQLSTVTTSSNLIKEQIKAEKETVRPIPTKERKATFESISSESSESTSTSTRLEKELESFLENISQVTPKEIPKIGLPSPLNIVKESFTELTPQAAAVQPEKPTTIKQEEQPSLPKATPTTQPPLAPTKPIILPGKQELKEVLETVSQKGQSTDTIISKLSKEQVKSEKETVRPIPTKEQETTFESVSSESTIKEIPKLILGTVLKVVSEKLTKLAPTQLIDGEQSPKGPKESIFNTISEKLKTSTYSTTEVGKPVNLADTQIPAEKQDCCSLIITALNSLKEKMEQGQVGPRTKEITKEQEKITDKTQATTIERSLSKVLLSELQEKVSNRITTAPAPTATAVPTRTTIEASTAPQDTHSLLMALLQGIKNLIPKGQEQVPPIPSIPSTTPAIPSDVRSSRRKGVEKDKGPDYRKDRPDERLLTWMFAPILHYQKKQKEEESIKQDKTKGTPEASNINSLMQSALKSLEEKCKCIKISEAQRKEGKEGKDGLFPTIKSTTIEKLVTQLSQPTPKAQVPSIPPKGQGIPSPFELPPPKGGVAKPKIPSRPGALKNLQFAGREFAAAAEGTEPLAAAGGAARGVEYTGRALSSAGRNIAARGGMTAGAMGGMVGVAGSAVTVIGTLASVVVTATQKLQKWSNSLHESNMKFAEFSGGMMGVLREKEARDIMLSHQKGEARAGSAKELAEAISALERQLAPIENIIANGFNIIAATIARGAATALEVANKTLELDEEEETEPGISLAAEMGATTQGVWSSRYSRPPRFGTE